MAVLLVKQPASSGSKILEPFSLTILDFDVTTQEQHKHPVEWTQNPVETGLEITDHAVVQPDELTITGVITDTPIGLAIPLPDRAQSGYETLLRLKDDRRLVTVVTGLRVYQDMAITDVSVQRDPSNGQAVRPTVSFRKVFIVNSVTIPIPPEILDPPLQPGGSSDVDAGKQPTEDIGDTGSAAADATPEGDAFSIWEDKSVAAIGVDRLF